MAKPKIKLLILGEAGVGKTSLLFRYTDDAFLDDSNQALGEDFRRKELVVDGDGVIVELWDTGGQERFRTITSSFYRGANAVLLAYDVTAKETLDKVSMWLQEVKQYSDDGHIAIAVVGCKSDLGAERQVSLQEAEAKFSGQHITVLETSAKENTGLDTAFMAVIKKAYLEQKSNDPKAPAEVPIIIGGNHGRNAPKKKESGCNLL
eukprot:Mycagemm_TRINITY_DN2505_c0_g1::TRINITY_DN2505_c0_g1_i1::g.4573::m.4573 type:complete len:206 gc:universal TRINITY_DN2505_c0_g1_i1:118-735(+)